MTRNSFLALFGALALAVLTPVSGQNLPIRIGCSQFMMDILGDCKGSQCQQN